MKSKSRRGAGPDPRRAADDPKRRMLRRAVALNERCIEWPRLYGSKYGGEITKKLVADLEEWLCDWMAGYDTIEGHDG